MGYKIVQVRFAGYPFYEVYQEGKRLCCFASVKEAQKYIDRKENAQ